MIRTCDGTDPNLTRDGKPCDPHAYIPTREEKEAFFASLGMLDIPELP